MNTVIAPDHMARAAAAFTWTLRGEPWQAKAVLAQLTDTERRDVVRAAVALANLADGAS